MKAKNLILFQVILLSILTFNCRLNAQINIFPGPDVTPFDMVECIVGEGVTFDNVTFQGAAASRGIFTNGSATNIGIESGIFLTSGAGYVIPGPNTSSSAGANNGMPGHASLNAITTSTTYDAAVLEFDFVPESDTLRFKYVFGSEEYNEWVGSPFNDVFGYFVTGPDPMGGFYSDKNIAIIPETPNTSVAINNVNNGYSPPGVVPIGPCMNCFYYSDNTNGVSLEYDGFTVVLIAWVHVVACETYHIKIGVADAGDHIYDSGVFIEENSFESPKIEVEIEPVPQGVAENMIEGCVEADIIFKLPNASYAPITVYFEVTGSATNGVDYDTIPDHITFEEGEDTAYIHVIPFKDGLIEGEEDIVIIIENTLGCVVRYDTVIFIIIDYINMVTTPSPNTMICEGMEVEIWVTTEDGIPPYTYEWLDLSFTTDTITVSPDTTTTYVVNVMDMCLDTISDSVLVTVFPSPDIDLGPDSVMICMGDTLILNAGGGYLAYLWQDGSTDSTYTVTGTGNYAVLVTGPGGCTGTDEIYVEVSEVYVNLGPDTTICIGDTLIIDAG
ncbi:MAG: choice-of-anchor L domain-containing protein, partial [Bacteroidetes bacterium]|nr:choice-of-anchor L domain-containing protein [Bacteroidota bacterium]